MLKRALDILVATIALMLLSPVLVVIAVAIRLAMGPPVFFRQLRPGLGGKPFNIVKFRTMRTSAEGEAGVANDASRLTPLGRFLRASSLDEVPELWNVLVGDMSLVGPRPLLMQYLERYSAEQARRHEVRPGLTGLTQVSGRNALDWEAKFKLDIWYVDHRSILLDLKILALTASQVLRRTGISAEGAATMPEFIGNEQVAGARQDSDSFREGGKETRR
jgi:lipopolysaccharide/colanic/teichoic acid biosynthesis glycosyltransferase